MIRKSAIAYFLLGSKQCLSLAAIIYSPESLSKGRSIDIIQCCRSCNRSSIFYKLFLYAVLHINYFKLLI